MAQLGSVGYDARHAYHAARNSDWLERLTRVGFVAKGIVYLLVGALALMAAFNRGGETTDHQGVIQKIATKPFGEFALIAIGVGLLAYAIWRFLCAFADVESKGSDGKGLAQRAGYVGSGIIHASIALAAFKLVAGMPSSGSGTQTWSARVLNAPGGELIMAVLGISIIIGGIAQFRHGWSHKFEHELRLREMSPEERQVASRAGKWGYAARGITFAITGMFVVFAAIRHDASQVKGLEGALDTLAAQPYGALLMALVAAGLIGYGTFCFIAARYRRIRT